MPLEGQNFRHDNKLVNKSAIPIENGFTVSRNGNRVPKTTTRGWSLLVSWKDGSSNWMLLKELKDSYPVQIAEHAMANKIANEPAFNWWVHTVLRKRNRIFAKVKRYWRMTHNFGIRLPKTVAEALAIDDETGTNFWRKDLGKEMEKSRLPGRLRTAYRPSKHVPGRSRPRSDIRKSDVT